MKYGNTRAIFSSAGQVAEACDLENSHASRDQKLRAHLIQLKCIDTEFARVKTRALAKQERLSIRDVETKGFDNIIEERPASERHLPMYDTSGKKEKQKKY